MYSRHYHISLHLSLLCTNQYFRFTTDYFLALGALLWILSSHPIIYLEVCCLKLDTRLQQKLYQPQLEGENTSAGLSGVRKMNFLLSFFSPLWVATSTCSSLDDVHVIWHLIYLFSVSASLQVKKKNFCIYFTSYLAIWNSWMWGTCKVSGKWPMYL